MAYPSNRRDKKPKPVVTEITDRQIAAYGVDLAELDEQIKDLQASKKRVYEAVRGDHGKKAAKSLKAAVTLFSKDSEQRIEAEEIDAEAQRMLAIIERGTVNATHVARGAREDVAHDEDGVIEDNEPADREHITGSVGKEFPNNEPAPPATPEVAADAGSDPASEAEEPGPDSSAPNPIEAPRGVEGEAEGASASPANSETPEPGAPAATGTAHNPIPVAVPGSIRTERTPPVGVVWHDYLRCFPEYWGKQLAAFIETVKDYGVQKPILMQGNVVIDGRARYNAARHLGVEYQVEEYAGDDPLRDIITLNMAARNLNLVERQTIAKKLIKLVPDRADEIGDLLDLSQQREAAQ